MNISVRFAQPRDADAVAALARANWQPIYQGYCDQLGQELYELAFQNPLDTKEASVRRALTQGRMFVAEKEGQICGFAIFSVEGEMGVLGENAVADSYRGQGIAKQLYERIFQHFRESGCKVASVSTGLDDAHAPARRAYEKMGFEKSLPSVRYFQKL